MKKIVEAISLEERLAGLAEECSELAQASLKLRRAYTQLNPTPVSEDDAYEKFLEEVADVGLYLDSMIINWKSVERIKAEKLKRWEDRLSSVGK